MAEGAACDDSDGAGELELRKPRGPGCAMAGAATEARLDVATEDTGIG